MLPSKSTLIVDLDNTLFDWVGLWHATFTALIDGVSAQTKIPLEELEAEIRAVHQKHGTSEYAFLLSDLRALDVFRNGLPAQQVFAAAISASRDARRAHLRLYPTVAESLLRIKGSGCQIIAYTESLRYYSFYRLKRLGLDGVIDALYSPEDHEVPEGLERRYDPSFYDFQFTTHRFTPRGELKPNPHVLEAILLECGSQVSESVYIGDSRHKDIAMANDLGVDCAWARYGEAQDGDAYSLLKRVTHWTDADVEREQLVRSRAVVPNITLDSSFSDIFKHFQFVERARLRSKLGDVFA